MRFPIQPGCRAERGYMLLTLMLFVALLAILSLGWIERVDFQSKRDREEELIHRGVQYSRAVRRFFKKFGRYPTRVEELEETNRVRFLRKRYKDPITGKDFKLLHMTDVQSSFSPAAASGLPPGAAGANPTSLQSGTFGASNLSANMAGPAAASVSQSPTPDTGQVANQGGGTAQGQPEQGGPKDSGAAGQEQSSSTQGAASAPVPGRTSGDNRVFGGGPIVGVASTSKEKSIREFNKKDHYNQWQFIYDPTIDRGGLLMTPSQPPLQGSVTNNPQQNAPPGSNTQGQNPSLGGTNPNPPGQQPQPSPQQPPQ